MRMTAAIRIQYIIIVIQLIVQISKHKTKSKNIIGDVVIQCSMYTRNSLDGSQKIIKTVCMVNKIDYLETMAPVKG